MKTVKIYAGMGTSPAMVDRKTGIMYENVPVMERLDPDVQHFIRLHEEGHYILQTTDEFEADRYALEKYITQGKSLSESVKAFTRAVSFNNPEHYRRLQQHLQGLYGYDYFVNGNQRAKPMTYSSNNFGPMSFLEGDPAFGSGQSGTDPTTTQVYQTATAAGIDIEGLKAETLAKWKKNPLNMLAPVAVFNTLSSILSGKDAWDRLSRSEKIKFIDQGLNAAFQGSNAGTSPKEIFTIILASVEKKDDLNIWAGKNKDIFPQAVEKMEKAYLQKFDQPKGILSATNPIPGRPGAQQTNANAAASRPGATSYRAPSKLETALRITSKKQGAWYYAGIALMIISVILFVYAILKKK